MDIQAEKLEILKMVLETENPKILDSIKKIFKKQSENDFWEEIPTQVKNDIYSGIQEIEKGDVIDFNDFIKKHK